ncbi:hypothetical protein QFC19_002261 [Naganishia cerealis]|uniref:Uncharacterized protein n=1 Tax=Naganishia cerealis TaxID=610337 RepID=A0ACC2WB45_9TREE|nr:hypothetical protein QFC19_002261 [Naganishia cerealis]
MAARESSDKKPNVSVVENGNSGIIDPSHVTLRRLWNSAQSSSITNSTTIAPSAPPPNQPRWTEEQLLKGIVIDYLSHAHFPNTVNVLLGLDMNSAAQEDGHEHDTNGNRGTEAKARDDRKPSVEARSAVDGGGKSEEEDVHMLSASTTLIPSSSSGQLGSGPVAAVKGKKGKFDPRLFVRQIEWRKEIRGLIISGRISDATALLRRYFPAVLDTSRDAYRGSRSTEGGVLEEEDEDEDMDQDEGDDGGDDAEDDDDDDDNDDDDDDDDEEEDDDDDGLALGGHMFGRTPMPAAAHHRSSTSNAGASLTGTSASGGPSSLTLPTNIGQQPRYAPAGPSSGGVSTGTRVSANAARGGAGSRFGVMTAGGGGGERSNGAGSTSTSGSLGDVQWTAHPKSSATSTVAAGAGPTTSGLTINPHKNTAAADSHHNHFLTRMMRIPRFPYARTYDRPTLLALNLDIQEFVEGLRVLQQQVPSSPSEAVSLAGSLYDEGTSTGFGAGKSMNGEGNGISTDGGLAGTTKTLRTTTSEQDQPMFSRPSTPGPPVSSATPATRKAARDAAILACLAHASRLDSATQHLRPREARRYAQQVQDVCGLLAYNDMEASPLAGYLEQERRVGLADMVEGCVMKRERGVYFPPLSSSPAHIASTGYAPQSVLESLWQQDAYLWHPEHGHLTLNDVAFSAAEGEEGEQGKRMRELALVSSRLARSRGNHPARGLETVVADPRRFRLLVCALHGMV